MADNKSSSNFKNEPDSYVDGMVEIKNGNIYVTDPSENGQMAKIIAGKGVKLFVDGTETYTTTAVTKSSDIKVILPNKEPERRMDINIAENNMSVSAIACYSDGEVYALKDSPPAHEMVIEAKVVKANECQCFTVNEAVELLKKRGIVYGIKEDRIAEAITKGNTIPEIVAEGSKPVDGEDDKIQLMIEEEKKFSIVNDRVDFYSIGKVTSVEPGQLVAEKIPGDQGQPGYDVFGKVLPAKAGKRLNMVAGKGVQLTQDGLKAYSKIVGRPELKGNIISVHEVYELVSNVDISTGNIEFNGDVVIKGDVTDGMKVTAGNTVLILGNVTNSTIVAGSDIKINKNVIGSDVKAGCTDLVKVNIINLMADIEKGLQTMNAAISALKDTGKIPKTYNDGQIVKLLIDTKFSSFGKYIIDLRSILFENREYIGSDMIDVGARLIKHFIGNGPLLIESQNDLVVFKEMVIEQIETLKSQLKRPSHISVNYIQNSSLSTSGNIIVTGKGCYNSALNCKGSVVFEKPGSVMRGGTIDAEGEVKIYELGSSSGAHTQVSTGKDSTIYCEIAHANSILKVGDMSSRLDFSVKKVKAYQYKGELMIERSKL